MYLPRDLISHLYQHLMVTHHPLSPPVLILVALEPDALCACRILTALLKRDYIAHKIQPISGYSDLTQAGADMVQPMREQQGGSGGVVVCLGVGGLVDMATVLGLDDIGDGGEDPSGGVEVWLIDARRPWNLGNVFGGNPQDVMDGEVNGDARAKTPGIDQGEIQKSYTPGRGGIIVYDDGDVQHDLEAEREAYCALIAMPDVESDVEDDLEDGLDDSDGVSGIMESIEGGTPSRKRKSWSDRDENDGSEDEDSRRRQRRKSNSVITSLPPYLHCTHIMIRMIQYLLRQARTIRTASH